MPELSVIIPSACQAPHVVRCVRRIAESLPGIPHEIVVVRGATPRAEVLRGLAAIPHLRLLEGESGAFNYPAANNCGVAATRGDLLLLLNDDVAPAGPGWFAAMVAHLTAPDVAAVGARLLYGDGRVQHNGVLLGLGGLCEHMDRGRAADDPGPFGWAHADRECSAVTAACLLMRRTAWDEVGGMDPRFAIALNDVDFCLRLRQAGFRIIQCASATLFHYESLSLGRHYAGARAALEVAEVGLLRARWGPWLARDPCYNPQAALEPGREWLPAFPPR